MTAWIQTLKGDKFDLLDPRPEAFDIEEVAHALSMINRFTGHTVRPYSVLEHSLHVADLLYFRPNPPTIVLAGLMHDCPEAFIGDVSSPLKKLLPRYQEIEARIGGVAAEAFGYPWPLPESVTRADQVMLRHEKHALLRPSKFDWPFEGLEGPHVEIPLDEPSRDQLVSRFLFLFDHLKGLRRGLRRK